MLKIALEFLRSEEMKANVFHLNFPKRKEWWPVAPSAKVMNNNYPTEPSQRYTDGTLVLNAPIGPPKFCAVRIVEMVRALQLPARSNLFQRNAALLVTNNALCPMSGLISDI